MWSTNGDIDGSGTNIILQILPDLSNIDLLSITGIKQVSLEKQHEKAVLLRLQTACLSTE
jgi:hypothetical protein